MTRPLVFCVAATGRATAARIADHVDAEQSDDPGALPRAFAAGRPVIGVCAAGILIRLLAPHLADKYGEPPVIAVAQDGAQVVPLLGGHHGANRLARDLAAFLGGTPALTTASDARFSRSLDEPPEGWSLADPAPVKRAIAAILAGASIRLIGDAPWLAEAGYPVDPAGTVRVFAGDTRPPSDADLAYHPRTLVAGMGCERGADAAELIGLLESTLDGAGLAWQSLAAIGTIDLKADEPALHAVAARFGVPLRLFTAAELDAERHRLANPSTIVERDIGVAGVAEAAALKAGTLVVEKHKSRRATCAIGRAEAVIDASLLGRAPGHLHIVGIGPGDIETRTASASRALAAATDWVGYDLYLDLIADLRRAQTEHRFPLGDEEARVRHALELAGQGKDVALVCSGDGQIYAMAALVFELLDAVDTRAVSDAARRIAITSHPGISALQAASAKAGALLGHDFCAISLSDLLTPRAAILDRLEAAATGDFVTALYNPRSQRRIDLLDKALAIFRAHRPPLTPVIVARSLGRPDETVSVTTLAAFDPASIDMMTIVLFGASTSRAFPRGDGTTAAYTPRGYAAKAAAVSDFPDPSAITGASRGKAGEEPGPVSEATP